MLPESPVWLLQKDRVDDARHSLRKLRGFSDLEVDTELRVLREIEAEQRAASIGVRFWDIFKKQHVKRTITAGSLFSLNQVCYILQARHDSTWILSA